MICWIDVVAVAVAGRTNAAALLPEAAEIGDRRKGMAQESFLPRGEGTRSTHNGWHSIKERGGG